MEYKIIEKIEEKGMTVSEFIEKVGWKQRSSLYNMMETQQCNNLKRLHPFLGVKFRSYYQRDSSQQKRIYQILLYAQNAGLNLN